MKARHPVLKWLWRLRAVIASILAVARSTWQTRSFDLTPVIVALILLAVLLAFVSLSGPIAPFVYPIL